jgi:hypothetical protein
MSCLRIPSYRNVLGNLQPALIIEYLLSFSLSLSFSLRKFLEFSFLNLLFQYVPCDNRRKARRKLYSSYILRDPQHRMLRSSRKRKKDVYTYTYPGTYTRSLATPTFAVARYTAVALEKQ